MFLWLLFLLSWLRPPAQPTLMEGDIVFQSTSSTQAQAILLATHSQFSHVGIVLQKNGKLRPCSR